MVKPKERSGWLLASVILTGIILFFSLFGLFDPSSIGTSILVFLLVGASFTLGLLGYINKNHTFALISAIINTVYSFFGIIGCFLLMAGSSILSSAVSSELGEASGILGMLSGLAILGVIYLVFLIVVSFIGFSAQKKLNQQNMNNKPIDSNQNMTNNTNQQ